MRVDLTFARGYLLEDGEDLDTFDTGWEFPPGRRVDPGVVRGVEQTVTISWSLGGDPPVLGETFQQPPPVCVAVTPDGTAPWLGIFQVGMTSARDTNAVVALPDGETFAVLSSGTAYRVWAADPERWEEINVGGVQDPVVSQELDLVAFADHTVLTAYGVHGLAWESERLVWDDLRPLRLAGDTLWMDGFDAPKNEIVPFTVDLRTGGSSDAPHPERRLRRYDSSG